MSTATMVAPCETLLGAPAAALGLRIRGTERDGQTVWLKSPKVTIGSSTNSTLRLRAAGVAPIHCLLLRGAQHTVVRRWSVDTRLDGAGFDDAPLAIGDRLGIGPLELEVIEEELQRREAAPSTAESSADIQSFQCQWADLETERRTLDEQRQRWSEVQAHTEQLLTRQCQQLDERYARMDQQAEQVNRLQTNVERQQAALEKQIESLVQQRATLEQRQTEIAQATAKLETERQALTARQRKEETEGGAVEDAFARLRALSLLRDEGAEEAVAVDARETLAESVPPTEAVAEEESPPVAPKTLAAVVESPTVIESPEEESIDDYMARLLARMRGEHPAASPPRSQSESTAAATSAPAVPKTTESGEPSSPPATGKSAGRPTSIDFGPRTAAPEKIRDLAAMRELANLSARTAIATHHLRRGTSRLIQRLLVGAVGLLCGIVLLLLSPAVKSPMFYGGLALIAASLCWLVPLILEARRGKSPPGKR